MSFREIIDQLSGEIGTELVVDRNNTVQLVFTEEAQVRLEEYGSHLLIGMVIGRIDAGPIRTKLFEEALIANGKKPPRHGTLAYSRQIDQLVIFEMIPIEGCTGKIAIDAIDALVDKGSAWQEALKTGIAP